MQGGSVGCATDSDTTPLSVWVFGFRGCCNILWVGCPADAYTTQLSVSGLLRYTVCVVYRAVNDAVVVGAAVLYPLLLFLKSVCCPRAAEGMLSLT